MGVFDICLLVRTCGVNDARSSSNKRISPKLIEVDAGWQLERDSPGSVWIARRDAGGGTGLWARGWWWWEGAGMGEPAGRVVGGDRAEGRPDRGAVRLKGAGCGAPEESLDLREGFLNRIEVRE